MDTIKTSLSIISILIASVLAAQSSTEYRDDIDTLYHAPPDKEIFFYNGYEPPERYDIEFIRKEGGEKVPFKIDEQCDANDPKSCVALYHFVNEEETATKWILRGSNEAKDGVEVIYGQRVGKDGKVVYSQTSVEPGEVVNLGYAKLTPEKETDLPTERYVWIVSASWK